MSPSSSPCVSPSESPSLTPSVSPSASPLVPPSSLSSTSPCTSLWMPLQVKTLLIEVTWHQQVKVTNQV